MDKPKLILFLFLSVFISLNVRSQDGPISNLLLVTDPVQNIAIPDSLDGELVPENVTMNAEYRVLFTIQGDLPISSVNASIGHTPSGNDIVSGVIPLVGNPPPNLSVIVNGQEIELNMGIHVYYEDLYASISLVYADGSTSTVVSYTNVVP